MPDMNRAIGQCHVIYDYESRQPDELTIRQGTTSLTASTLPFPCSSSLFLLLLHQRCIFSDDVINIYDKQDDGWWLGELGGRVGVFPGSYVQDTTEVHL